MQRVSVIIVNYNGRDYIQRCLESMSKQKYDNFEIVIVDNASQDDSLIVIKNSLIGLGLDKTTKIIELDRNLGFAGSNVRGFENAHGEYIALLNADAIAEPLWLQNLVNVMDSENKIGICASKIISYESNEIDSAGDGFSKSLQGFKRGEGELPEEYGKRKYIFGACACAALYRRTMLKEVGFFDEDFFLIHEDTDLNLRAQLRGWKILYVPEAVVYHKVRSSIGNMSDTAVYYTIRNRDYVRIKNIPAGIFLRCFPGFVMSIIAEFIYFVLKYKKLKLYIRAKKDVIRMLPEMMKKRSSILKRRQVPNDYLTGIMTPLWERGFAKSKLKKILYG